MRRLKLHNYNNKNTIKYKIVIVFFLIILSTIILFNIYAKKTSKQIKILVNEQIDKVIYEFFNDLITEDVINKESVNNILEITKNNKGKILAVNYDLEKTYTILTKVSNVLQNAINDLESGKIDVTIYNKYLTSGKNGLIFKVPFFISSNSPFLNNFGPQIPIIINFNETILTNVKTKVTDYGFNNALLEVYVTVEMQKLIITPMDKDSKKFNYDILVSALVVNGSVPEFYGGTYERSSKILDIPLKSKI